MPTYLSLLPNFFLKKFKKKIKIDIFSLIFLWKNNYKNILVEKDVYTSRDSKVMFLMSGFVDARSIYLKIYKRGGYSNINNIKEKGGRGGGREGVPVRNVLYFEG